MAEEKIDLKKRKELKIMISSILSLITLGYLGNYLLNNKQVFNLNKSKHLNKIKLDIKYNQKGEITSITKNNNKLL